MTHVENFFSRCGGVLGWDLETNPLKDFFFRRTRTMQFGNQTEQYVIDLLPFCDNNPELLLDAQGHYGKNLHLAPKLKQLLEITAPIVCTNNYQKVGVNLGFEYMSHYWLFGQRTYGFFDCSVVERCISAGAHSLKDYDYFGMEEMMDRYFKVLIDKELQMSFTLDAELTDDQIAYAALDTRFPIALKAAQTLVLQGQTAKGLKEKGNMAWKTLANLDPLVTGDNLLDIAKIENDAIGAFQDMHVHGDRLDRVRWLNRIAGKKTELKALLSEVLDPIFLPIVGSKLDVVTEEQIEQATETWKAYNVISDDEIALKAQLRTARKLNPEQVPVIEAEMLALEGTRKAEKEVYKSISSELGKRRIRIKNLAAKCEGEALLNYSSDAQLMKLLVEMKGLKNLKGLDDETLEKYEKYPVMVAIRKFHGLSKEIGTYGDQWALEWLTKPCKEEGWLHPGDGRLHCVYNQYDAETGRSSSEKPNGQNLPADPEVRQCFISDPPNENIRISNCCQADTSVDKYQDSDNLFYVCESCHAKCETHAEEYVLVTADMSGAELRIIAELANDPIWISAFGRGEDVHSVGTEILYAEKWPTLQYTGQGLKNKKTGELEPYWCEYFKLHTAESVLKNPKATVGEPMRQKCSCPEHKELRDGTKATNFLLAYGGGPGKLASSIKKTLDDAKKLMHIHSQRFPRIWKYLEESGRNAKIRMKSFDMFGRRRLFPKPDQNRAKEKAMADREEQLQYEDDEKKRNIDAFMLQNKRKPTKDELWFLGHRMPSQKEINNAYVAMHSTVERQGKNHAIQGTNATIAKLAMGSGFDKNGKPYLWHILPTFRAILIKFVHDELVIQSPKQHAEKVAEATQDAFRRAAAEKMTKVIMESDYGIATFWKK